MEKEGKRSHVLLLPYPSQGHINPTQQFAKRLNSKGIKTTLVTTIFLSKSTQISSQPGIETISDGYNDGGFAEADSLESYLQRLETVGSETLTELIKKLDQSGNTVNCIIYDAFLPWALKVARNFGLIGASFFTQACAVNTIYYQSKKGLFKFEPSSSSISSEGNIYIPGLPSSLAFQLSDLPSFLGIPGSYLPYFELVLNQFVNVEEADWIFINTFYELELQVVDWMTEKFPSWRTIGPTIPSAYLDKRIKNDTSYGLNLYEPDTSVCMEWLNSKDSETVVFVSFGSMAELNEEQMEELAKGLIETNFNFLWVVRASEESKLSNKILDEIKSSNKGLTVRWSPQLEVLSHEAVGCFVTHCGWNSTLEALSLGVPMVGIPQWTDQPTNAKLVEDEWGVGVRVKVNNNEKKITTSKEIELCIREVMEGERREEIKRNVTKWKKLAQEAVDAGGSSDKNIDEFVAKLISS